MKEINEDRKKWVGRLLSRRITHQPSWIPRKYLMRDGRCIFSLKVPQGELKVTLSNFVLTERDGTETVWQVDQAWPFPIDHLIFEALKNDPDLIAHPIVVDWIGRQQMTLFVDLIGGPGRVNPMHVDAARGRLESIATALIEGPVVDVADRADIQKAFRFEMLKKSAEPILDAWWQCRNSRTRTAKVAAVLAALQTHPDRQRLQPDQIEKWLDRFEKVGTLNTKSFEQVRILNLRKGQVLSQAIYGILTEETGLKSSTLRSQVSRGQKKLEEISRKGWTIWSESLRRLL